MRQNYLETIEKNYKHLHPDLLTLKPSFFVKSFWDAIQVGTPEALQSILKQENPGKELKDLKIKEFILLKWLQKNIAISY